MHSIEHTVNLLHKRPGWNCSGVCPFVSVRPNATSAVIAMQDVCIANEQFATYESDLGMT